MSVAIVKFKKFTLPRLPYRRAVREALGSSYELDIIFVPSAAMRNLNKLYRRVNKSTNVLSFALSPALGQLFFDLDLIAREARSSGETFRRYFWRIFVHGLLHLKGFRHGREMDAAESKIKI